MSSTAVLSKTKKAKPFLKWAGGKGQLIKDIDLRLPAKLKEGKIKKYVEPFIGGGAVFFHIVQQYHGIDHFYLNDANRDLANCYLIIQNKVNSLIQILEELQENYLFKNETKRKELYYQIRDEFNVEKTENACPSTTAKLLFLNKTCFNGLYRVNRKGGFNVPFGKYKNPKICNTENLLMVSELLQRATILCGDFEDTLQFIDQNSFIYLDPPYRPISKTASFTSYSKEDFSEQDQIRLADFCKEIDGKSAKFLLSNSDPKNEDPQDHFFEDNYQDKYGFKIERVKASRAINCKGDKRGQINELIITN